MNWKSDTKAQISQYQRLDKYSKYADLEEFLQWLEAEGHKELASRIRGNENNRNWCEKSLINWRKDHVSPWILFTYARDFATSGSGVLNQHLSNNSRPPGNVVYFLYGRGIELFLKAFLVARGNTACDIRESYGHNLYQLLKEARRRKLGHLVALTTPEVAAITLLSISYSDKQYEYPVLGGQVRPDHNIIKNIVKKMEIGLNEYCRRETIKNGPNKWHT